MEYRGFLNVSVLGDLIVVIKTEYKETTYLGTGKNLEWTDAFANLQKALPDGVKYPMLYDMQTWNSMPIRKHS